VTPPASPRPDRDRRRPDLGTPGAGAPDLGTPGAGAPDTDAPTAGELVRAITATRAELAATAQLTAPPEVVARWTAAVLAAGRATGDRTGDTAGNLPGGWLPGRHARSWRQLATAVAAVAAVGAVGAVGANTIGVPSDGSAPARVSTVDLAAAGTASLGVHDLGLLSDPQRRSACLAALAVADATPLGGRRVVLDGHPGVMLVLGTVERGRLRLVVVDPGCGPDGGTLLADTMIGR